MHRFYHIWHICPRSQWLPLCNSFSSSCNLSRLGEYQIQPTIDWIRWKLCQEVMSMLFQDSRCFKALSHCVLLDVCTSIKPNRHRSISSYMPSMGRVNVCPRPWLATVVIPLCPQLFNFLQTKKRHTSEQIRYQTHAKPYLDVLQCHKYVVEVMRWWSSCFLIIQVPLEAFFYPGAQLPSCCSGSCSWADGNFPQDTYGQRQ